MQKILQGWYRPLLKEIQRREKKQDEGLNTTTKAWEKLRDSKNKKSSLDL